LLSYFLTLMAGLFLGVLLTVLILSLLTVAKMGEAQMEQFRALEDEGGGFIPRQTRGLEASADQSRNQ